MQTLVKIHLRPSKARSINNFPKKPAKGGNPLKDNITIENKEADKGLCLLKLKKSVIKTKVGSQIEVKLRNNVKNRSVPTKYKQKKWREPHNKLSKFIQPQPTNTKPI